MYESSSWCYFRRIDWEKVWSLFFFKAELEEHNWMTLANTRKFEAVLYPPHFINLWMRNSTILQKHQSTTGLFELQLGQDCKCYFRFWCYLQGEVFFLKCCVLSPVRKSNKLKITAALMAKQEEVKNEQN